MRNPYYGDYDDLDTLVRDVQIPAIDKLFTLNNYDRRVRAVLDVLIDLWQLDELSNSLIDDLAEWLDVDNQALENSLRLYKWDSISKSTLELLAKRLLGNISTLREGKSIALLNTQQLPTAWSFVRVLETRPATTFKGERGFELFVHCYTGPYAGRVLSRVLRMGKQLILGKEMGLTWEMAESIYPEELANMIGFVLMKTPFKSGENPYLANVLATAKQKKGNKKLCVDRQDRRACPRGWKPEPYRNCLQCPLGYEGKLKSRVCPLAVRRTFDEPSDPLSATGEAPRGD